MLLNAKTAINLEQVLDHLSSKGTLGKVDKLHTVDGKQVRDFDLPFISLASFNASRGIRFMVVINNLSLVLG